MSRPIQLHPYLRRPVVSGLAELSSFGELLPLLSAPLSDTTQIQWVRDHAGFCLGGGRDYASIPQVAELLHLWLTHDLSAAPEPMANVRATLLDPEVDAALCIPGWRKCWGIPENRLPLAADACPMPCATARHLLAVRGFTLAITLPVALYGELDRPGTRRQMRTLFDRWCSLVPGAPIYSPDVVAWQKMWAPRLRAGWSTHRAVRALLQPYDVSRGHQPRNTLPTPVSAPGAL